MTMLEAHDLSHSYRSGASVGPIDLTVPAGGCLGLVGANGAGKTTVLRMLLGLLTPHSGEVLMAGAPPVRTGPEVSITGMIEEPAFYPFLTARSNLEAFSGGVAARIDRIPRALATVELDTVKVPFSQYSQGMRQRLGIARALMLASPVIIFDEPTNGLDPVFLKSFRDIVQMLQDDGHAIVLSSHMLHEVQQMSDSYLMLDAGTCIARGEPPTSRPGPAWRISTSPPCEGVPSEVGMAYGWPVTDRPVSRRPPGHCPGLADSLLWPGPLAQRLPMVGSGHRSGERFGGGAHLCLGDRPRHPPRCGAGSGMFRALVPAMDVPETARHCRTAPVVEGADDGDVFCLLRSGRTTDE